ncbi:serine hydrolase domain-containing protein [Pectobacterium odoriferum]|uniref:serine hydrolase domain-containing protein n=1 Tax=Pectobacterium odoriferum TaxID=78398 RepID=UPI00068B9760|nr:serine hydrolase domain-containing protein [Pectobacterium odoriferum]POD98014.1 hypothetical protein BVY05_20585 [Pectobacterium odoriferum]
MRCLIASTLLLFCSLAAADEISKNSIMQYMDYGHIPELVLVTIDKNKQSNIMLLSNKPQGGGDALDDKTLFELASVSKSFTGMLAAKLMDSGVISANSTINSVLNSMKTRYQSNQEDITFSQLLNHTSGIPFNSISLLYTHPEYSLEQVVDHIDLINLDAKPGEKFAYATANYAIAARMMEKVSGRTYAQLLQEEILTPLAMEQATVAIADHKAQGNQIAFLRARPYDAPFVFSNVPAGYIQTSARDMLHWLQFLTRGSVSPALQQARETAFSTHFDVDTSEDEETRYSFGWFKQGSLFFHTGMNPTFSSYVSVDTATGVATAVMANVNSNITFEIGKQVMRQLNQGESVQLPGEIKDLTLFDSYDRFFIVGSAALLLAFAAVFIRPKWRKTRQWGRIGYFASAAAACVFAVSIFLLLSFPSLVVGLSWRTLSIWLPMSFWMFYSLLLVFFIFYFVRFVQSLYRRRSGK